jgi:GntR family transcriptional regulator
MALDDGSPLFAQIAEQLAGEIVDGSLVEGARVPSTNELASFYRINPATAAKGINVLVDKGLLEKRRGVGIFVTVGARKRLLAQRRQQFADPSSRSSTISSPARQRLASPHLLVRRGSPGCSESAVTPRFGVRLSRKSSSGPAEAGFAGLDDGLRSF